MLSHWKPEWWDGRPNSLPDTSIDVLVSFELSIAFDTDNSTSNKFSENMRWRIKKTLRGTRAPEKGRMCQQASELIRRTQTKYQRSESLIWLPQNQIFVTQRQKRRGWVGKIISDSPELRWIDNLVLVQGFRHIIRGVELGSSHRSYFRSDRLLVRGERASVLILNCPQATLVVHLRPTISPHSPHHVLVPTRSQCLHHRDRERRRTHARTQVGASSAMAAEMQRAFQREDGHRQPNPKPRSAFQTLKIAPHPNLKDALKETLNWPPKYPKVQISNEFFLCIKNA